MKLYVNMVDYSQREYNNRPVVYFSGRTPEREYQCLRFTHFEPSFYVKNRDAYKFENLSKVKRIEYDCGFVDLYNEPMTRIVGHMPADIGTGKDCLRNVIPREESCQGDVLFHYKVWLDIGSKRCIEITNGQIKPCDYFYVPKRISYLDIETGGHGNNVPDYRYPTDPVILHTSFDNYTMEFDTFMFLEQLSVPHAYVSDRLESHAPSKFQIPGYSSYKWNIYAYDNEKDMLNAVIKYYESRRFDVLTGWNSSGGPGKNHKFRHGFDLQYLVARMRELALDYSRLSPIGEVHFRGDGEVIIKMVLLLDLMYFWIHSRTKESKFNNLDYVSQKVLQARKVKRKGKVIELLNDSPKKAREYNAVDVELCVLLDHNLNLIEDKQRICDEDGIFLSDALFNSVGWDIHIIRKFNQMGIVLPNKPSKDVFDTFKGAFVHRAFVGVEENVAVLDLTKLYPYIMMSLNADPRTLVVVKDGIPEGVDLNDCIKSPIEGVYFKKEPTSIYVELYDNYIKLRNQYKKEMAYWKNKDKFKYEYYNELQMVTKYKTNSLYGYIGMKRSRLANKYIAESTTLTGQALLKWTIKKLNEIGYTVIYGDSDSVMVKLHEKTIDDMIKETQNLCDYINKSYDEFASNLNMDKHFFNIKPELIAKRMLMQESKDGDPSKKTYAMWVIWEDGVIKSSYVLNKDNRLIKGFTLKKSNFSSFGSDVQLAVIDAILKGCDKSVVKQIIKKALELHKVVPLEEIMIPATMSKRFSEYGGTTKDGRKKSIPFQVKAAMWSNANLGTQFGAGSKFYVLYTNLPGADYVAIPYGAEVPLVVRDNIDWRSMEQRNIWSMISGLLKVVGLNEKDIKNENTTFNILEM